MFLKWLSGYCRLPNPLFSTYSQGEYRIISTVIAILERVNNQLAGVILEVLTNESDLSLVSFFTQVARTKPTHPSIR